jgi:hypothetical protein
MAFHIHELYLRELCLHPARLVMVIFTTDDLDRKSFT